MPFTRWEESISSLQRTRLRAPLSFETFGVETGGHEVFHERACELASRSVYMRAGRAFAPCPGCRDGVLYHLMGPSR
jgi:hypothetical protein